MFKKHLSMRQKAEKAKKYNKFNFLNRSINVYNELEKRLPTEKI